VCLPLPRYMFNAHTTPLCREQCAVFTTYLHAAMTTDDRARLVARPFNPALPAGVALLRKTYWLIPVHQKWVLVAACTTASAACLPNAKPACSVAVPFPRVRPCPHSRCSVHFSLLVVCHPGTAAAYFPSDLSAPDSWCILHFDSLQAGRLHPTADVCAPLLS
jgi:hypothetical protein